ncbi:3-oxoacyl-ACP synthase III family protein [Calothrix sp. UHCC 0171]|uniref:3-oxoacyl-ACP synthase III family protein n=1 Tax=Calothrix sp. UHCC 0171 TaxID=3110245 RepID=UPI002B2090D8|nr:3-oxoacyl-ACP synthase III family protein [Calothrix sp. UHCC 0171]MEA5571203.1 3-oxoacyl-ACP synthase III family protein [Calothrix sp. UHCC 0171]
MHIPVGIKSLAVSFPSVIRTNDYFKEKYPDLVAKSEENSLGRMISLSQSQPTNEYELEMIPFLSDPFRGTVERRALAPDESSLTLEYRAAKDALAAANISPSQLDLVISSSFPSEYIASGNAAFVARELGLECGAWNLDAACGSPPVALETACSLIQSGRYRNILVTTSCTYSRLVEESDPLSWFFGDGAGAFVVSSLELNQGILGSKTINTSILCDQLRVKGNEDEHGNQRLRMQMSRNMNRVVGNAGAEMLRTCCEGAVASAGVTLSDINFFIFNTPTAWFSNFCIRVLGINPERTIDCYPSYANIGPALTLSNLYYAQEMGKIRENDLILMYGFGAASSASATVMRWGDVAIGAKSYI